MRARLVLASLSLVATVAHADDGAIGSLGTNRFFPPAPIEGLGTVTAIASSTATTCAIVGGEVFCWGWMAALAGGADTHVPTKLPGLAHVTQLSVGSAGACARLASGQVRCFGRDFGGPQPRPVANLARAQKVSVTNIGACALRDDGRVLCWTAAKPAARATPIADAVDVTANLLDACAARKDGTVVCFRVDDPARQRPIPHIKEAISVTAQGHDVTCALEKSGAVKCWADDWPDGSRGPCGVSDGGAALGDHTPVAVLRSGGVVSIGLGNCGAQPREGVADAVEASGTCALRRDGAVLCWGRNDHGELGRPPQPTSFPARRKY